MCQTATIISLEPELATHYVTGLHKHLFFRWFNAPFNKSMQATMNLCVFQAAAVRKPHKVYVYITQLQTSWERITQVRPR